MEISQAVCQTESLHVQPVTGPVYFPRASSGKIIRFAQNSIIFPERCWLAATPSSSDSLSQATAAEKVYLS